MDVPGSDSSDSFSRSDVVLPRHEHTALKLPLQREVHQTGLLYIGADKCCAVVLHVNTERGRVRMWSGTHLPFINDLELAKLGMVMFTGPNYHIGTSFQLGELGIREFTSRQLDAVLGQVVKTLYCTAMLETQVHQHPVPCTVAFLVEQYHNGDEVVSKIWLNVTGRQSDVREVLPTKPVKLADIQHDNCIQLTHPLHHELQLISCQPEAELYLLRRNHVFYKTLRLCLDATEDQTEYVSMLFQCVEQELLRETVDASVVPVVALSVPVDETLTRRSVRLIIDREDSSEENDDSHEERKHDIRNGSADVTEANDVTIIECQVCMEPCVASDGRARFITMCDHHPTCTPCMIQYLESNIASRKLNGIRCPGYRCRIELEPLHNLQHLLTPAVRDRLTLWKQLDANQNLTECCQCFHLNDKTLITRNGSWITCAKCQCVYCYKHALAHPVTQSCSSYERAQRAQNNEMIKETSIACPGWRCNARITKNGGCNHLTCTQCGCESCWLCGGLYFDGLHYDKWWWIGCYHQKSTNGGPNSRRRWWRPWLRGIWFLVVASVALCLVVPIGCIFLSALLIWVLLLYVLPFVVLLTCSIAHMIFATVGMVTAMLAHSIRRRRDDPSRRWDVQDMWDAEWYPQRWWKVWRASL